MDYLKTATLNESESRQAHAMLAGNKLFSINIHHYAYLGTNCEVSAYNIKGARDETDKFDNQYNECGVNPFDGWRNIVSIETGYDHTVGLKGDGKVIATNFREDFTFKDKNRNDVTMNSRYHGQCDVRFWSEIKSVIAGCDYTLGLKEDGTITVTGDGLKCESEVLKWRNVAIIKADGRSALGLKEDGTVVVAGNNERGGCNVDDWSNIVDIYLSGNFCFGLKANGTVVVTYRNDVESQPYNVAINRIERDLQSWNNIVQIVSGGVYSGNSVFGLKADGSVIYSGEGDVGGLIYKVAGWRDIVALEIYNRILVGIKKDGSLVSCKLSKYDGDVDLKYVKLFKNVDTWEQERLDNRKKQKRCLYCGNKFKGVFSKTCRGCGKPKDY